VLSQEDLLFPEEITQRAKKPDFKLEIPKELTVEKYMLILQKIFACIRHQVYSKIRVIIREQ